MNLTTLARCALAALVRFLASAVVAVRETAAMVVIRPMAATRNP